MRRTLTASQLFSRLLTSCQLFSTTVISVQLFLTLLQLSFHVSSLFSTLLSLSWLISPQFNSPILFLNPVEVTQVQTCSTAFPFAWFLWLVQVCVRLVARKFYLRCNYPYVSDVFFNRLIIHCYTITVSTFAIVLAFVNCHVLSFKEEKKSPGTLSYNCQQWLAKHNQNRNFAALPCSSPLFSAGLCSTLPLYYSIIEFYLCLCFYSALLYLYPYILLLLCSALLLLSICSTLLYFS